jgi:hypothetical protein
MVAVSGINRLPGFLARPNGESSMTANKSTAEKSTSTESSKNAIFSLDTWAVTIAFILALAVKFGILKNVPW